MLKSYRVLNRTGFTKVRFAVNSISISLALPSLVSLPATPSFLLPSQWLTLLPPLA